MLSFVLFAVAYLALGCSVTYWLAREDRATGKPFAFDNTAGYAACVVLLPVAAAAILLLLLLAFSVWPLAMLMRRRVESKPPLVDLPPDQMDAFFSDLERQRSERPN